MLGCRSEEERAIALKSDADRTLDDRGRSVGVEATKVARHAPNFHPPGSMAYYDRRKCVEAIKPLGGARTECRSLEKIESQRTLDGSLFTTENRCLGKVYSIRTDTVAMDGQRL